MTWGDGTSGGRTAGQVERGLTPSGGSDTTQIQAAIDACATAGGGVVLLGPGTFLASALVLKGDVTVRGAGIGATTLKLANGANTDLVKSESFDSLTGGVTRGGPENWAFENLTLDGNKANNTVGWPLRVFGAAYRIENVEVQNGASGGVFSEWGTGGTDMEAFYSNFRIHDCTGVGLDFRGPHDSAFVNGFVFKNTGNGVQTGGNATSELFTNVHSWGTEQDWAFYLGNAAYLANCQGEGGSLGQVMVGSPAQIVGGTFFGTGTGAEVGIQVGDATHASVSSVGVYGVYLKSFSLTGQPLNFYSSGGGNTFQVTMIGDVAVTVINGTPAASDEVRIRSSTTSISNQSVFRQYGRMTLDAPAGSGANTVFTIKNSGGLDRINFNASTPKVEVNYGGQVILNSGSYTGQTILLDGDGYQEFAEVSAPSAPASGSMRLFGRDSGGVTQYAIRFPTGAIQVLAEEFGAAGDGTTDDRAAIQAAIDAAAANTQGGDVILKNAVYAVKSDLEMKAGVRLVGTHHPHWIASSGTRGTTIKAVATWAGTNAVISISDGGSENSGGGLRGLHIEANDLAARGVYILGKCNEWDLQDLEITNATGNGLEVAASSGRQCQELYCRRVFARSNTGKGFMVNNAPDLTFVDCGAMSNASHGWNLQQTSNTRVVNCFAEWNLGMGLVIDGGSATDGLRFTDFSTDSNYDCGVWVGSCSDSRPIVFNGLHLRRDGRDLGATGYGLAVGAQGSGFSAPVVVNNLRVTVKPDDGGGTLYRPITAVRVGAFADAVLIGGASYIWGVTNAITSGAAASVTRIGKPTALVTGDPGSQSRSYVSTTTATYTVD